LTIAWIGDELKKIKDSEPSYKGFYDFFNIKPRKKKHRKFPQQQHQDVVEAVVEHPIDQTTTTEIKV
jgi:hypothetical protein